MCLWLRLDRVMNGNGVGGRVGHGESAEHLRGELLRQHAFDVRGQRAQPLSFGLFVFSGSDSGRG